MRSHGFERLLPVQHSSGTYSCVALDMAIECLTVDNHNDIGANLTGADSTCNSQELKCSCFDFNNIDCSER